MSPLNHAIGACMRLSKNSEGRFRLLCNEREKEKNGEKKEMRTKINGELEIDHESGAIYFHTEAGRTILRIKGLPAPISEKPAGNFFDVRFEDGSVNWESIPIELNEKV